MGSINNKGRGDNTRRDIINSGSRRGNNGSNKIGSNNNIHNNNNSGNNNNRISNSSGMGYRRLTLIGQSKKMRFNIRHERNDWIDILEVV